MKGARRPAGSTRPAKKHKVAGDITKYLTRPEQQDPSRSSSCSPAHAEHPTPAVPAPASWSALHTAHAGAQKVDTNMLKSLQRKFVQQSLQTPFAVGGTAAGGSFNSAPPCCERAAGDLCDDFVLHSSQTYERGLSQLMPPWDEGLEGGSSTQEGEGELTQTQVQLAEASQRRQQQQAQEQTGELQRRLRLGDGGAQPSSSSVAGQGAEVVGPLRRISSVSNCSNRTTPGVPMVRDEEAAACSGAVPRLFPVFRSRKDYKVLHIIRHGESEYNAADKGPDWHDPEIFDAPLTARGVLQAKALVRQLAALNLPSDALFVVSPLTRAIQTLLHACPSLNPARVLVRSEITEKMATTGDVGHPPVVLAQRFPLLAEQLLALPDVWWHTDPAKPNCALTRKFMKRESTQQLQKRVAEFKRWLLGRPEKVVVAVGHSLCWRELMKGLTGPGDAPPYMRNCELRTLHI